MRLTIAVTTFSDTVARKKADTARAWAVMTSRSPKGKPRKEQKVEIVRFWISAKIQATELLYFCMPPRSDILPEFTSMTLSFSELEELQNQAHV